jgi:hypothetical protein
LSLIKLQQFDWALASRIVRQNGPTSGELAINSRVLNSTAGRVGTYREKRVAKKRFPHPDPAWRSAFL